MKKIMQFNHSDITRDILGQSFLFPFQRQDGWTFFSGYGVANSFSINNTYPIWRVEFL